MAEFVIDIEKAKEISSDELLKKFESDFENGLKENVCR